MNCSLKKLSHNNISKPQYAETFFKCPIVDRQICLWCCLHIGELADPKTRLHASEFSTEYDEKIPKITTRDWDDMWVTCQKCRNR